MRGGGSDTRFVILCDETEGEAWSLASFSEAALLGGGGGGGGGGGRGGRQGNMEREEKLQGRGSVKGWCGWTHLGWTVYHLEMCPFVTTFYRRIIGGCMRIIGGNIWNNQWCLQNNSNRKKL